VVVAAFLGCVRRWMLALVALECVRVLEMEPLYSWYKARLWHGANRHN